VAIDRPISPDRWRALEPLLDAALDLAPGERSGYLRATCGDDPALHSEIVALLAACEHGDGMLERSAAIVFEPLLLHGSPQLPAMLGGRYHIVREIGRGGMATVYLADDPKHRRQVAVKVLHADVARVIGRERFLREIAIAAGLSHPHILPLHDSGEVRNHGEDEPAFLYSVSPFVTGESLRNRLQREGALAVDETLRLGREIALALDYAHRQCVVHLDVKPENILLQDGHAIIADFGIARAMCDASEGPHRDSAPLLGTPSYMSPEQAAGAADIDGRSDIYSLGCVLFEMATGERPHGRITPGEAVERARTGALPDPSTLTARVPADLAAVILRAIRPDRRERLQTAGELAAACACIWADTSREKRGPGRGGRSRALGRAVACRHVPLGTGRRGARMQRLPAGWIARWKALARRFVDFVRFLIGDGR
jgi:serine/threonine-protein kinase